MKMYKRNTNKDKSTESSPGRFDGIRNPYLISGSNVQNEIHRKSSTSLVRKRLRSSHSRKKSSFSQTSLSVESQYSEKKDQNVNLMRKRYGLKNTM